MVFMRFDVICGLGAMELKMLTLVRVLTIDRHIPKLKLKYLRPGSSFQPHGNEVKLTSSCKPLCLQDFKERFIVQLNLLEVPGIAHANDCNRV